MEKGKCRVNLILDFEKAEKDTVVNNLTSQEIAKKGDYIIKNPHGFSFVVDEEYFKENYEVIEEAKEEKEEEVESIPDLIVKTLMRSYHNFVRQIITPSSEIDKFFDFITTREEKPKMIEFKEKKDGSPLEGELKMDEKDIKNILPKGNYLFLSLDDYKRLTNLTLYNEEHTDKSQEVSRDTLENLLKERIALRKRITELLTKNPSRIPSNIDFNLKVQKELIEEIKEIEKYLEKFKEEENEKM